MVSPSNNLQRQEEIDVNYRRDTTSELLSSASCGCRSACEPILNMDGTVTTCSSTAGIGNNFRRDDNISERRNNNQTNTAFTNDENNFEQAYRNHGKNIMYQI